MKSPEQVKIDLQAVLDQHERHATLKDLLLALCKANNGMTLKELAVASHMEPGQLRADIGRNGYSLAKKICEHNAFGFSADDGSDRVARQIMFTKTRQKRYWSDDLVKISRQAVTEEVNDKVARYRAQQLSASDLPHLTVALRGLYPKQCFDRGTIQQALLHTEARRVAAGKEPVLTQADRKKLNLDRVKGFFDQNQVKPTAGEYTLLLEAAGVAEEDAVAFKALPVTSITKETEFSQSFANLLEKYVSSNRFGRPNLAEFLRFTQLVDAVGEGLSHSTITSLVKGENMPTQHTVRLLAQAFMLRQTGKAASHANELSAEVTALIESAGFLPAQLFRTAHQVIADAGEDMFVFELFRQLRLASDINKSANVFVEGTDISQSNCINWETGVSFPRNDTVMNVVEQLIARTELLLPPLPDGQQDRFSDGEKKKIRTIAQHSLNKQLTVRSELNDMRGAVISETLRRQRAKEQSEESRVR